jgi:deoxyadenosine/deoxycytidine kinase
MYIVLTGTHGVGKSTLAEHLVSVLEPGRNVRLIPETARELVRRGIKVNDEMTEDGFIAYIKIYLQTVRESQTDIVVADRALFDLYLYTHNSTDRIRPLYVEMLRELVFIEAKTVDFYVYLPIEFPMQMDAVRPADKAYQLQIDRDAVELLRHFGTRTVIARGSLSERAATVIEHLQNG